MRKNLQSLGSVKEREGTRQEEKMDHTGTDAEGGWFWNDLHRPAEQDRRVETGKEGGSGIRYDDRVAKHSLTAAVTDEVVVRGTDSIIRPWLRDARVGMGEGGAAGQGWGKRLGFVRRQGRRKIFST